jgi:hypothetical protein
MIVSGIRTSTAADPTLTRCRVARARVREWPRVKAVTSQNRCFGRSTSAAVRTATNSR